jgi:hypothetical protein
MCIVCMRVGLNVHSLHGGWAECAWGGAECAGVGLNVHSLHGVGLNVQGWG